MRIAVFGAGGVGGYFGGRLAEAGADVTFIARGAHLAALQAGGLRVASIKGDFHLPHVRATDAPASVGPVDVVLLCVKAWQVAEACEAMRPMVGPGTMVVPLENGVEAPDEVARVLGAPHAVGGLCRILAYLAGPGEIRHAAIEPSLAFGELDRTLTPRVEALRQAFAACAGVTVEIPPDIRVAMWAKFLFIAPVSGVGAVTRVPIGVFRHLPATRSLLIAAFEEIVRLAASMGVALPGEAVQSTLAFTDAIPPDGTSSMQRDILDGRPSELEAQLGAVVRLGERHAVPVPVHRFLYAALLPQERRARGL